MTTQILYVEDDPSLREWVAFELSCEGFSVQTAGDGDSGLKAAMENDSLDVILLDVQLPGQSGFDICRRLQEEAQTAHVPVIFLTARGALEDRLFGFDSGGIDYLTKPFAIAELKARISALLRQKQATAERQDSIHAAEMAEAAQIQANLIRREATAVAGLDIFHSCLPAREIGGDFYDFQQKGEQALNIAVADVSGKGMPAALLMTATRSALRSSAKMEQSPAETLTRVNTDLYDDLTETGRFVTLFLGQYDDKSRHLTYANAGHALVIYCPVGEPCRVLQAPDAPIGVLDQYTFTQETIRLENEDLLLVCSDGLFEARDSASEQIGIERFVQWVEQLADCPPHLIGRRLLETVDAYSRGHEQDDDQTLVILKGRG